MKIQRYQRQHFLPTRAEGGVTQAVTADLQGKTEFLRTLQAGARGVSQAISRLAGQVVQSGDEVGSVFLDYSRKLKQTVNESNVSNARNKWVEDYDAWRRQQMDAAQQIDPETGQPNYMLMQESFEEFQKDWWEQNKDSFAFNDGRRAFEMWHKEDTTLRRMQLMDAQEDLVIQRGLDDYDENYKLALQRGDLGEAVDLTQGALEAGLIDDTTFDDRMDSAFYQQHRRRLRMTALQVAQEQGYDMAMQFAMSAENLEFKTYTGEDRRLDLADQEALVEELQLRKTQEQKARLDARRAAAMEAYNEAGHLYDQGDVRGLHALLYDPRTASFDGQPMDVRNKIRGWLKAWADSAETGAEDPNQSSDPAVEAEYYRLRADPYVPDEAVAQFLRENQGVDPDTGEPRLGIKFVADELETVGRRRKHEQVVSAMDRINSYYDERISRASRDDDEAQVYQLEKERADIIRQYATTIQTYDEDNVFYEKPELAGQLADNLMAAQFDKDIQRAMERDINASDAFADRQGFLNLDGSTNVEELQQMIQDGQLYGIEGEFGPQLRALEAGYTRVITESTGRQPSYSKVVPGGRVHLFYRSDQAGRFTARNENLGANGVYFTYENEGNDLALKVWNGYEWMDPPEDLMQSMFPDSQEPSPTTAAAPRPGRGRGSVQTRVQQGDVQRALDAISGEHEPESEFNRLLRQVPGGVGR